MSGASRIFRLTSWSLQSTPAELSIASVLWRPPCWLYSVRPRCVIARFAPSPITFARSSLALMRTLSFTLSPTSPCDSVLALTYVPMPPNHMRSTSSWRIARTMSGPVTTFALNPSSARASGDSVISFAARSYTPPPFESASAR